MLYVLKTLASTVFAVLAVGCFILLFVVIFVVQLILFAVS